MTESPDGIAVEILAQIAGAGRFAATRGWVPATGGNFSCRIDERSIAITRSGAPKDALTAADIVRVPLDGPLPPGISAESPLHLARYRSRAAIGAVLHVHSVASTVLSRLHADEGEVSLYGYEMHKALEGFATHESSVRIPIFGNRQDTAALAEAIERRLGNRNETPGYLLAGHGLYVWGASMTDARRHLEGLEFLLECHLEERRLTR
ncbi:MAG TPA: methylthioribulose 1-phosphate dehydratase [Candidatus Baltobacteraceae bacterium]|jgi:methylthioribulose-1-phosphate dehydratase